MTSRADERAAAVRARLEAATPGPWQRVLRWSQVDRDWTQAAVTGDPSIVGDAYPIPRSDADADLIANAPVDLAWLLAERERLTQALRRIASAEGFEGAGMIDGGSFPERELRARMRFADEALAGADGDA